MDCGGSRRRVSDFSPFLFSLPPCSAHHQGIRHSAAAVILLERIHSTEKAKDLDST
jgi:hypothetical protein